MLFAFEQDFSASLHCIPMIVRYKLDRCGIKLKLQHWMKFSLAQRQMLIDAPCENETEIVTYTDRLQSLIEEVCGETAKTIVPELDWQDQHKIPDRLLKKAQELDVTIPLTFWQQLTPLQRFVLTKLSQGGHENRNFLPALQEFGLQTLS